MNAATLTKPPPAMPPMSARESDAPRVIEYAGPESRYHRLRREAAAVETGRAQVTRNMLDAYEELCAGERAIAAAIKQIRVIECHCLPHGTYDVCGEPLDTRCCNGDTFEGPGRDCVYVYALEVPLEGSSCNEIVYARTVEDAACELLMRCTDDGDQTTATVKRVAAMIERSFAAKGGAK